MVPSLSSASTIKISDSPRQALPIKPFFFMLSRAAPVMMLGDFPAFSKISYIMAATVDFPLVPATAIVLNLST